MISSIKSNPKFHNAVISTGNILNAKNPSSRPSEELLDGLKLTLQCAEQKCGIELNETQGQILRAQQELVEKTTEDERSNISIGAKIFLNQIDAGAANVRQALQSLFQILAVQQIDNVVLAYHPADAVTTANGELSWSARYDQQAAVGNLKAIWRVLEEFAQDKRIVQLGIADVDVETLSQLHAAATVTPTIMQVSIASCCVVPPELKLFCSQHDIQLLTHSDPEQLLRNADFIIPDYSVNWIARYQIHLRCRGVLTAKGYIVGSSAGQPPAAQP